MFKKIKKYLCYSKTNVYIAILHIIIFMTSSAVYIYIPIVINQITYLLLRINTNQVDVNQIWNELLFYSILAIALEIISTTFDVIGSCIFAYMETKYAKDYRLKIDKKLNTIPLIYFQHNDTGDILNTIVTDCDWFSEEFYSGFLGTLNATFFLIGIVITMFMVSWQISLVVLAVLLFAFVIISFLQPAIIKVSEKKTEVQGKNNAYIEEMYVGNKIIKSYNQTKSVVNEYKEISKELFNIRYKNEILTRAVNQVVYFNRYFAQVMICITATLLIYFSNPSSTLQLISLIPGFFIFADSLNYPLTQITNHINMLVDSFSYAKRIYKILEQDEIIDNDRNKLFNKTFKGNIEFNDVSYSYNDKKFISNLNLKIKAGQHVAIVGPTGAGKSTITSLILKYYLVNSGSISIDGININDIKDTELRSKFGVVLQDQWMFEGTIKDNLIFTSKNINDKQLYDICKQVNIYDYIMNLPEKFDTLINESFNISQGFKQLFCIARALLHNPEIIILDEATANVDTINEKQIQIAIKKLLKNKTAVIVAHRLSTIIESDKIIYLNNGKIIEEGNHKELLHKHGLYYDLYNSQFNDYKK